MPSLAFRDCKYTSKTLMSKNFLRFLSYLCKAMDVELLARMIGELVTDHDQVGLPGVGTFVAEVVPATFSDKGYTINPPYRRLSFHPSRTEDKLLVDFYAESNGIAPEAARAYLTRFLLELKTVLKERKTIVLPGLGRLRATLENNFFFVPDENLDIYPEGFALKPVSLKAHGNLPEPVEIPSVFPVQEMTPQPQTVAAETASESEALVELLPEEPETIVEQPDVLAVETVPQEADVPAGADRQESLISGPDTASASVADEEEPVRSEGRFIWWIIPVSILVLAVLALLLFLVLADAAPDFIDSLLYTPEELRIINY